MGVSNLAAAAAGVGFTGAGAHAAAAAALECGWPPADARPPARRSLLTRLPRALPSLPLPSLPCLPGSYIFSQTLFSMRLGVDSPLMGAIIVAAELAVFAAPVNVRLRPRAAGPGLARGWPGGFPTLPHRPLPWLPRLCAGASSAALAPRHTST